MARAAAFFFAWASLKVASGGTCSSYPDVYVIEGADPDQDLTSCVDVSLCPFECQDPSSQKASGPLLCDDTNNWDPSSAKCGLPCELPPLAGRIHSSALPSSCANGFEPTGVLECSQGVEWAYSDAITCQPLGCVTVPSVSNAELTSLNNCRKSGSAGEAPEQGTTCTVDCAAGYRSKQQPDSTTVSYTCTCTEEACEWGPDEQSCVPYECTPGPMATHCSTCKLQAERTAENQCASCHEDQAELVGDACEQLCDIECPFCKGTQCSGCAPPAALFPLNYPKTENKQCSTVCPLGGGPTDCAQCIGAQCSACNPGSILKGGECIGPVTYNRTDPAAGNNITIPGGGYRFAQPWVTNVNPGSIWQAAEDVTWDLAMPEEQYLSFSTLPHINQRGELIFELREDVRGGNYSFSFTPISGHPHQQSGAPLHVSLQIAKPSLSWELLVTEVTVPAGGSTTLLVAGAVQPGPYQLDQYTEQQLDALLNFKIGWTQGDYPVLLAKPTYRIILADDPEVVPPLNGKVATLEMTLLGNLAGVIRLYVTFSLSDDQELSDLRDPRIVTVTVEGDSSGEKANPQFYVWMLLAAVLILIFVLLIMCCWFFCCRNRSKRKAQQQEQEKLREAEKKQLAKDAKARQKADKEAKKSASSKRSTRKAETTSGGSPTPQKSLPGNALARNSGPGRPDPKGKSDVYDRDDDAFYAGASMAGMASSRAKYYGYKGDDKQVIPHDERKRRARLSAQQPDDSQHVLDSSCDPLISIPPDHLSAFQCLWHCVTSHILLCVMQGV
eukprot:gene1239-419_t